MVEDGVFQNGCVVDPDDHEPHPCQEPKEEEGLEAVSPDVLVNESGGDNEEGNEPNDSEPAHAADSSVDAEGLLALVVEAAVVALSFASFLFVGHWVVAIKK